MVPTSCQLFKSPPSLKSRLPLPTTTGTYQSSGASTTPSSERWIDAINSFTMVLATCSTDSFLSQSTVAIGMFYQCDGQPVRRTRWEPLFAMGLSAPGAGDKALRVITLGGVNTTRTMIDQSPPNRVAFCGGV